MMHGEWDTKPGYTELAEDLKLECGPMPNVMAALPNIGVAPSAQRRKKFG